MKEFKVIKEILVIDKKYTVCLNPSEIEVEGVKYVVCLEKE